VENYSTVNSAQRLSATLSIRPRGRVQIIDMLPGIILACEDIRVGTANLQLCAKNLNVCVSCRLSTRSVMICERKWQRDCRIACASAISGLSRFAGEKQIGRARRVPIEVGPVAFQGSFSLPVSAQLGSLGLLRLVLRSMASHPERAPKATRRKGPFVSASRARSGFDEVRGF
jgi:hypothetical protein